MDSQTLWELFKVKMKELSIRYSKGKSTERKIALVQLYSELNDLDTALARHPQCTVTQRKREHVKLKLKLLEQYKARAAQVRARARTPSLNLLCFILLTLENPRRMPRLWIVHKNLKQLNEEEENASGQSVSS